VGGPIQCCTGMRGEGEGEGEGERMYTRPITIATHVLLRDAGLFKYYEEATSLKEHSRLLVHLIRRWDVHR
jgi:hypothetical protein